MSKLAFEDFKERIKLKALYTPELLDGYAKDFSNRLNRTKITIENSDYLKDEIKRIVLDQLEHLEDLIEVYKKNPYPDVKHKIQFNWSRTDVIYFFHLLRKNNVIADIGDADLGRLIDNAAEYYHQGNNQYQEISASKKHLNAFLNTEGRPEDPANKRLRNIFQNDDFYNV